MIGRCANHVIPETTRERETGIPRLSNVQNEATRPLLQCELTDDTVVGVDDLVKLPDDQWHRLYPLDFLLRANQLALEILHLVLDVFLLPHERSETRQTRDSDYWWESNTCRDLPRGLL